MVDIQETPAVPPFDPQGDERRGYFIAGGLLIFLGWGLGVVANALLHYLAPKGGMRFFGVYFAPALGSYAWATLAFGLGTGAMGIVLLLVGRSAPKGAIVLPGYDY